MMLMEGPQNRLNQGQILSYIKECPEIEEKQLALVYDEILISDLGETLGDLSGLVFSRCLRRLQFYEQCS